MKIMSLLMLSSLVGSGVAHAEFRDRLLCGDGTLIRENAEPRSYDIFPSPSGPQFRPQYELKGPALQRFAGVKNRIFYGDLRLVASTYPLASLSFYGEYWSGPKIGSVGLSTLVTEVSGRHTLRLLVTERASARCLKQEIVSGCYAGEDHCETRCVLEEPSSTLVLLDQTLYCTEIQ